MNDQQNYEYGRLETLYKEVKAENLKLHQDVAMWTKIADRNALKVTLEKERNFELQHELEKYKPRVKEIACFYLFDNHTSKRLTGNIDEMLAQATAIVRTPRGEFGMLCSPSLVDHNFKEIRRVGICVHARSSEELNHWAEQCRLWRDALEIDKEFMAALQLLEEKQKVEAQTDEH